jgi:mannose-1-phosphate guanylyltransferase
LWKAGNFCGTPESFIWSVQTIIREFGLYLPDIAEHFDVLADPNTGYPNQELMEKIYALTRSISIDYGILEKSKHVYVIPASFGWSDLGTWKSLHDVSAKNEFQTAIIGKKVMTYDSENSLVFNHSNRLVVLRGVNNLVVVDTGDVLLIIDRDREQEIRQVVADVREAHKDRYS